MDKEKLDLVRKLSQQYAYASLRMHETVARSAGIPGTDHKYLGFFLQQGSLTAGELAVLTGLTTGAVTGLVDRFEKKGLVRRQLSAEDRRKVIIVPDTKKIMALLEPFYEMFRIESGQLLASFTSEEMAVIERYFRGAIDVTDRNTERLGGRPSGTLPPEAGNPAGDPESRVLDLKQVDKSMQAIAGGKGAHLGELSRLEGIRVPGGFCVTAGAYGEVAERSPELQHLLDRLALAGAEDRVATGRICTRIREVIENLPVPGRLAALVTEALRELGEDQAFAVRSSATAEDLPGASFAGQQDTYLGIVGGEAVLQHIRKCWASLFTDRAVAYRVKNGFDHRSVRMAVVVQRMVFAQASGVLFTADPVSFNRKVSVIEACFGLGEALVSGRVNADSYAVRDGKVIHKKIAEKRRAVYALKEGGTREREIGPGQWHRRVLTEGQVLQLEQAGRRIEACFGTPQDIEWCISEDKLYIVQSRPVTTLFPVPETGDGEKHVFVSVGHQQMMTDPIKPLGLSVWQLTARRPMYTAGGRLFVDVAAQLASSPGREMVLQALGQSDPLIGDALAALLDRGDFIRVEETEEPRPAPASSWQPFGAGDPAVVTGLIRDSRASIAALKENIRTRSGPDLFAFIRDDIRQFSQLFSDPRSLGAITAAIQASAWLNEKLYEWLGEKNAADVLSRSVDNNVTAEMGLALLDVADVIRPYPGLVSYLQRVGEGDFPEGLAGLEGGGPALESIRGFLDRYGMRGPGEIDITRDRWAEKPDALIPALLGNIRNFGPGAGRRKFVQGRREAREKEEDLLRRLRALPEGDRKAAEAKQAIGVLRNFAGYREYPKYDMVSRYYLYKQALLKEGDRLVKTGVIPEKEDMYFLTLEELEEAVRTGRPVDGLIGSRKAEYRTFERLTPPRVLTSEGEIVTGAYKRAHLPLHALAGLAVSSGVAEGRARVISNMEKADLEEGDILVTAFTDPGWTPLFLSVKGLVTEVGGWMTHGAVIAREYGLPAVVGVENATRLIRDGQRIRVNGTDGYVELL